MLKDDRSIVQRKSSKNLVSVLHYYGNSRSDKYRRQSYELCANSTLILIGFLLVMEKCLDHDLTPNQTTDATIDKLIKEVKELSAENALLKDENKRLIKDKSNTRTHAPVVTEP